MEKLFWEGSVLAILGEEGVSDKSKLSFGVSGVFGDGLASLFLVEHSAKIIAFEIVFRFMLYGCGFIEA